MPPLTLLSVSSYAGAVIFRRFRFGSCVKRIRAVCVGSSGRADSAGEPATPSESATSTPNPHARRLRPRIRRGYTGGRRRRAVKRRLMSTRSLAALVCALVPLAVVPGGGAEPAQSRGSFVTRSGAKLVLEGPHFRFAGANVDS